MYVFPNAAPQAAARLRVLADVFDPGTVRHLEARGVASGWTCLEVGGGLGTMTCWLADRVGQRGELVDVRDGEIEIRQPPTGIRYIQADVGIGDLSDDHGAGFCPSSTFPCNSPRQ